MEGCSIESNIKLDMTNCEVNMMSCLCFVADKPKIRPFFCSGQKFGPIELKFCTGVNFQVLILILTLKFGTSTL